MALQDGGVVLVACLRDAAEALPRRAADDLVSLEGGCQWAT
jgi:hypothetical protein